MSTQQQLCRNYPRWIGAALTLSLVAAPAPANMAIEWAMWSLLPNYMMTDGYGLFKLSWEAKGVKVFKIIKGP